MTRWAATAMAVVITVGVGSAGQAAADNGRQRNRIDGQIESDSQTVLSSVCDPAGHCVISTSAVNQWIGGLDGATESRSVIALDQATGQASIQTFELFTGTVEGCGQGSFTMSAHITRLLSATGTGRLTVVEGSGSGQLQGISGRGTFAVTPTGPASATSTFSLDLRCSPAKQL